MLSPVSICYKDLIHNNNTNEYCVQLQIRGDVLCRLGVMMLTRNNVYILGGEVESLVEENTTEYILQRALWVHTLPSMPFVVSF